MKNKKTLFVFYFIVLLFSCFIYYPSNAQNNKATAEKIYQKALLSLDEKQYDKCIPLLEQSIQADVLFIDPVLTLFQVNLDLRKYTAAISLFNKAMQIDSVVSFPYFIKQAGAYASLGDYKKASEILQYNLKSEKINSNLIGKAKPLLEICTFALAQPKQEEITIHNLGDSINTAAAEYFPCFSNNVVVYSKLNFLLLNDLF